MTGPAAPLPAADAPHDTILRVRYEETDRMGIVYHGKFFEYFEVGRTEWLRARGLAYRDLEEKGFGLVVSDASARYRSPARYDDLITVRTTLCAAGRVTLEFRYEVLRGPIAGDTPATPRELLAEGSTRLVAVGPGGRPRRMLPELAALVAAVRDATGGARVN